MTNYGPNASKSRSLLTPENQELFDWFTQSILNEETCIVTHSIIQAIACQYPNIGYWNAVAVAKQIITAPEFNDSFNKSKIEAVKTLGVINANN